MTPEELYYQEYQRIMAYLRSKEYQREVRRDYEKAVALFNLTFGTDYTPEAFMQVYDVP